MQSPETDNFLWSMLSDKCVGGNATSRADVRWSCRKPFRCLRPKKRSAVQRFCRVMTLYIKQRLGRARTLLAANTKLFTANLNLVLRQVIHRDSVKAEVTRCQGCLLLLPKIKRSLNWIFFAALLLEKVQERDFEKKKKNHIWLLDLCMQVSESLENSPKSRRSQGLHDGIDDGWKAAFIRSH